MDNSKSNKPTLLIGECVACMQTMASESVDLTVTSPPYDNLRAYNGFVFDFVAVATELFRITKEGGVVVWVVGDAVINGSESGTSFSQALTFMDIGFRLHDTMIYQKRTGRLPESTRYTQTFEYMFVLSKGKPTTTNITKIQNQVFGRVRKHYHSAGRVQGENALRECDKVFESKSYINRNNIWNYAIGSFNHTKDVYAFRHPAMFPEKLAEDHILSWSNAGDLVFDPFTGSGTTGKMAILNDRRFVGVEISEDYFKIAIRRINEAIVKRNSKLF